MTPAIKILRSLIREIIRGDISLSLLSEGGNAFPGKVNSLVPSKALIPNIRSALKSVGLQDITYEVVGNQSKDYFGDIDIAVDAIDLKNFLKVTSDDEMWVALSKFLEGHQYVIQKGLSQFHILSDLQGSYAIDPETRTELIGTPGKIQIDVFVGDLKWMKDTSSGSPKESQYKAVYRNFLLFAILGAIPAVLSPSELKVANSHPEKNVKKKILTNFRKGVIERLYYDEIALGKSGKPLKEPKRITVSEKITSNPDDITNFFLKSPIPWSKINSYELLFEQLMSDNFKFPEVRDKILDTFKSDLLKNGFDVPHNITE